MLCEVGPSASCCREAALLIEVECECQAPYIGTHYRFRPLTDDELADVEAELMDDLPRAQRRAIQRRGET
jgi:hypothetical protein